MSDPQPIIIKKTVRESLSEQQARYERVLDLLRRYLPGVLTQDQIPLTMKVKELEGER